MADIVEKLRLNCNGHPYAKVPWPHRVFHEAIGEIEALRAELEQAQETIKDLDYVKASWRNGFAKLMREHEEAKATIARQREWIRAAGHRPGCEAPICAACGEHVGADNAFGRIWHIEDHKHPFQPGPCSCGWAELVGG